MRIDINTRKIVEETAGKQNRMYIMPDVKYRRDDEISV